MILRKTSNTKDGFTLLEVIVVLGIFALLTFLALGIGVDTLGRGAVGSERTLYVELLEKARNRSMDNIAQLPHGVHVTATSLVLFQGAAYSASDPMNEISVRNPAITVSGPTDVVFTQLSGTTTNSTMVFLDGAQHYSVTVNTEGRIDW